SGPNDARNVDRLLAALDGTGADLTVTVWVLMTVATYVIGAVLREVQEQRWQRAVAETTAEMTEAEVTERLEEFNRRVRQSGQYPHLIKLLNAGIDPDSPESRDDRFEFGLSCLLDGIAARIRKD
ncbi:MAG: TetR/AcrR family transcriptional regulator C-terminal domain-containing protein, partial [Trebonia sp.]